MRPLTRDGNFHSAIITQIVHSGRPGVYLELGVHQNETMGLVAKFNQGTRLIGVDRKEPYERIMGVEYYIETTQEFLTKRLPEMKVKLGVVFIDADHTYESAKWDFEMVWPFVEEQGIVLLHDTFPEAEWEEKPGYAGDSWRFAVELRERGYDTATVPIPPGLTIVRKRERGHLAWRP